MPNIYIQDALGSKQWEPDLSVLNFRGFWKNIRVHIIKENPRGLPGTIPISSTSAAL